jgi:sugar lactone lactonase YvrE
LLWSGFALAEGFPLLGSLVAVPDESNNRVLIYLHPRSNDQPADVVLGQTGHDSNTPGTSSTTMTAPTQYAIDNRGNLYVSDSGNCRVLRFSPPFADGEAANLVIGQADANTGCGAAASASVLGITGGLAFDRFGNLWVADMQNSRVLRFTAPLKTGEAADVVIGQPNFTSIGCASTQTAATLCGPVGVAFDIFNHLWVADQQNNRILEYSQLKNNQNANLELGQPSGAGAFSSNSANDGGISSSTLDGPAGIAFDWLDRLWVADEQNNRVLMFNPGLKNGNPAHLVLGQPNFTNSSYNQGLGAPTAATLYLPEGIVVDFPDGNVWVGDSYNSRTVKFPFTLGPPFGRNGADAQQVLGQPDFVSNLPNQGNSEPGAETESFPFYNPFYYEIAGPSLIALAVLAFLVGCHWLLRRRKANRAH